MEPHLSAVFEDPVVRALLEEPHLMRLAYVRTDGMPAVVPIWFLAREGKFIVVTGPKAAKVRHLRANPNVAFTIDTPNPPYRVLLGNGTASLQEVDGMAPEYEGLARRYLGPVADGYLRAMGARVRRQVRIETTPRALRVFDFEQRRPRSLA